MPALGLKQIIAIGALILLIAGVGAGVYLVQRQQTLKSRATGGTGNFVNAFEIREQLPNGSPGPIITCDDRTNPPTCTTSTLNISVKVKDVNPLLPQ